MQLQRVWGQAGGGGLAASGDVPLKERWRGLTWGQTHGSRAAHPPLIGSAHPPQPPRWGCGVSPLPLSHGYLLLQLVLAVVGELLGGLPVVFDVDLQGELPRLRLLQLWDGAGRGGGGVSQHSGGRGTGPGSPFPPCQPSLGALVPSPHPEHLPHPSIPPTSSSHSVCFSLLATSNAVSPAAFTARGTTKGPDPGYSLTGEPPNPPLPPPWSQPHTRGEGGFALQEQLEAVGLVVERAVVQSRVPILRHPVQRPPAQGHQQEIQGSRARK